MADPAPTLIRKALNEKLAESLAGPMPTDGAPPNSPPGVTVRPVYEWMLDER